MLAQYLLGAIIFAAIGGIPVAFGLWEVFAALRESLPAAYRRGRYSLAALFGAMLVAALVFAAYAGLGPTAFWNVATLIAGSAVLLTLAVIVLIMIRYTAEDVLDHRSVREVDKSDHVQAMAADRPPRRRKRKWWRRLWPNRYRGYGPGRIYETPSDRESYEA